MTDTTCGTRLFLIILLAFVVMRIIYLFYLKNDQLDMKSDDVKLDSPIRHVPMLPISNKNHTKTKLAEGNVVNTVQNDTANIRQKIKKKSSGKTYISIPYTEAENVIQRVNVPWTEFVALPLQPSRNKMHTRQSLLNSLIQCPDTLRNGTTTCSESWSDSFVSSWRTRKVKELCEEGAASKIHCYDSRGKSRYCIFENAMMNFKKVRKRKQDGAVTRSWERGFLSADCGEFGKDDIGYLPLYKPDIEGGQEEAVCDHVFNETVLVYSHENIRNFGQMATDYLNVWAMLWLSGLSQESRDISFFNIDAVKKGRYFGDQPNQFFRHYNMSFRRILKAADFAESGAKLCFKKLIMQPRPALHFQWEGNPTAVSGATNSVDIASGTTGDELAVRCGRQSTSSLFQRFNLQIRQNYGLFGDGGDTVSLPTNSRIRILLLVRSLSGAGGVAAGPTGIATAGGAAAPVPHITSRIFINGAEIVAALESLAASLSTAEAPVQLVVQDLAELTFDEQVRLMASSSLVVGMHGAGIASSMHMPIGSRHCCAVVEIFPQGEFTGARGYGYLARRMGHHYERLDLSANTTGANDIGSSVPVSALTSTVNRALLAMNEKSSCFLPSVIAAPYL